MDADELANKVRSGSGTLSVTNAVLNAHGLKVRGRGTLRILENRLILDFESSAKTNVPQRRSGVWHQSDLWKLTGTIEGDLKFSSYWVSPMQTRQSFTWGRIRASHELNLDRIDVLPVGLESLSRKQRDAILQRKSKVSKHPSVEFDAVFVESKSAFLNASTWTQVRNDFLGGRGGASSLDTFIDRADDYDFALINREPDLDLHFRSKRKFKSISRTDDWRRFEALLAGIGFTHGFNPWPYRIEYWRDGRKLLDRLTAPSKLTSSTHAPFSSDIAISVIGRRGARDSAVRLAARFFEQGTPFSKEISNALFLFREAAGRSTHFHIRTLALCSLFEKLVEVLFDGLQLERGLRSQDLHFDEFRKARDRLRSSLQRRGLRKDPAVYQRLVGCIANAEPVRLKDKFKALCDHFGLNYDTPASTKNADPRMKPRFDSWYEARNRLAHGNFSTNDSDFQSQSQIAGAINVLILKLIGYSGLARTLAFVPDIDGRYQRI